MGSKVAIAVLAAGLSTRTGSFNKLLSTFGSLPLVRLSVQHATDSIGPRVIVVTGHMAEEIREAISHLDVTVVHNGAFASGMSSSVRTALQAVPDDCEGVLIHLADMPFVDESHMTLMIDAFNECRGSSVVRATAFGEHGNPVVIPRKLFRTLGDLDGDRGARQVIAESGIPVIEVEIGAAAMCDVDTVEALDAAGGSQP